MWYEFNLQNILGRRTTCSWLMIQMTNPKVWKRKSTNTCPSLATNGRAGKWALCLFCTTYTNQCSEPKGSGKEAKVRTTSIETAGWLCGSDECVVVLYAMLPACFALWRMVFWSGKSGTASVRRASEKKRPNGATLASSGSAARTRPRGALSRAHV